MKKNKNTFLLLSLLFLIVGCSSNRNIKGIDEETLKTSIGVLNARDTSFNSSYYFVNKSLNEKYGNKYLNSTSKKEIIPVGNKPSSSLVDYDASSFPEYQLLIQLMN